MEYRSMWPVGHEKTYQNQLGVQVVFAKNDADELHDIIVFLRNFFDFRDKDFTEKKLAKKELSHPHVHVDGSLSTLRELTLTHENGGEFEYISIGFEWDHREIFESYMGYLASRNDQLSRELIDFYIDIEDDYFPPYEEMH